MPKSEKKTLPSRFHEALHPLRKDVGGLDIGAEEIWVDVGPENDSAPVRRFETARADCMDRIVVLAATELTTPNEKHAVRQSSNSYVFLSICPRKIYSVAYDFSSNLAGEIPILTASYMCKTADRTHTFRSGD